jgi:hypothetical protein
LGAFAYWVDENAAKVLLRRIDKWSIPVDQYYARYVQKRYTARVCFPYLMIADVGVSNTGQGPRDTHKVKKRYGWDIDAFV